MSVNDKALYQALRHHAAQDPESVLADLLMLFPVSVVVKLLITFSGEVVRFPKVEDVVDQWRANVVVEVLSSHNTRRMRAQLAKQFGISEWQVLKIFQKHQQAKHPPSSATIQRSVQRVFRYGMSELQQQLRPKRRHTR